MVDFLIYSSLRLHRLATASEIWTSIAWDMALLYAQGAHSPRGCPAWHVNATPLHSPWVVNSNGDAIYSIAIVWYFVGTNSG